MKLLTRWLINAVTLLVIPYVVPAIAVESFWIALLTALMLGLLNVFIRPLLIVLTLPLNVLTLGLFTFVINALLFWFAGSFIRGFYVTGFGPALLGSLFYSVVSSVLIALLLPDPDRR